MVVVGCGSVSELTALGMCSLPSFHRSFLRLGSPLCCTLNDISIQQLEQESGRIASRDDPSSDEAIEELTGQAVEEGAEDKTVPQETITDKKELLKQDVEKDDSLVKTTTAKHGGSLSLARIQSLVTMTTPRSSFTSNPSFIEIDHSIDGFGCLFLPSVFPQTITSTQQTLGESTCT